MNDVSDNQDLAAQSQPTAPSAAPEAAAAPQRAFPQQYKFLWGALLVLIGTFLPFGPHLLKSMFLEVDTNVDSSAAINEKNMKELAAKVGTGAAALDEAAAAAQEAERVAAQALLLPAPRPGNHTFMGCIVLMLALAIANSQINGIRERRLTGLGGVFLMLVFCGWAWFKLFDVAVPDFDWGGAYQFPMLELLVQGLGGGFLLILIGSSIISLTLLKSFASAMKPAQKPAVASGKTSRAGKK
ncbi:MAG: hypothetical protein IPH13_13145 [Planctomycetes bacterium]|nr:hypothetical protein [Planctomycetota bacterium]MCC7172900.1 hypothetical protein [Planctomycetota bacterium]